MAVVVKLFVYRHVWGGLLTSNFFITLSQGVDVFVDVKASNFNERWPRLGNSFNQKQLEKR